MANDRYYGQPLISQGPMVGGFAITPSNSTDFSSPTASGVQVTRAIWVGGTGNLHVVLEDNSTVTLNAVPTGTMMHLRVKKVLTPGTTASNLVGLF